MSAARLRKAAAQMRDEVAYNDPAPDEPILRLAVADWLDATADHADATGGHCVCDDAALAVADAYLGTTDA